MRPFLKISLLLFFGVLLSLSSFAQLGEPWTKAQLKKPSVLALELSLPKEEQPLVIDMGPAGVIKNAIEIGAAEDSENMKTLKATLKDIPRDKEVIVYCGCCPLDKCPNARPAFQALLDMGFKNPQFLLLPQNLKIDWIDKGYPIDKE